MMQVTLAKFSRRIAEELLKNVFRESLESVPANLKRSAWKSMKEGKVLRGLITRGLLKQILEKLVHAFLEKFRER